MINIDKIEKLAKENYYLTSLLRDFIKNEAQTSLSEELVRIYFLAKIIAVIGDDIYYEFFKPAD